jgi:hypothetical protein
MLTHDRGSTSERHRILESRQHYYSERSPEQNSLHGQILLHILVLNHILILSKSSKVSRLASDEAQKKLAGKDVDETEEL